MFPIIALRTLTDVLKKGLETDETQQAKLSLLIHLTKTPYDVVFFASFIDEIAKLTISTDPMAEWQSAARSVVSHSQVFTLEEDN